MAQYYFIDSAGNQQGPVEENQLYSIGLTPQTMVWRAGMQDWMPAGELPELSRFFQPQQPAFREPYRQEPPNSGYRPQQPQYPQGGGQHQNRDYHQHHHNQNRNAPQGLPPNSYMIWAILTTILCCLPFGIVSIIYASKVDSAWSRGEYKLAHRNSELAKKWAIWSAVAAAIGVLLYVIFWVSFGVAFYDGLI